MMIDQHIKSGKDLLSHNRCKYLGLIIRIKPMKNSRIGMGRKMRYSDHYSWTINVSIGSPFGMFVRVWVGDVNWTWESKRPLKIVRIDTLAAAEAKAAQVLKDFKE